MNMTGEYVNNARRGTNDLTVGGGISSLMASGKKEGTETITPKPLPSMMSLGKGVDKADNSRPPMYVPT